MRQNFSKDGLALALLAGLLLWVLPAAAQDVKRVVFATIGGGGTGFLTDVIKAYGIDAKNGVDLDLKAFDAEKAQQAVLFRQTEVGVFNPLALARANLKGNKIRLFGPQNIVHFSVLVPKNSAAQKLSDLKSKKLGVQPRISGVYNNSAVVFKMFGLDLEKDFNLVISAPVTLVGLFQRGDLDAMVHFEPFVSKLIAGADAREILRLREAWREKEGSDLILSGLAAYEDWIESHAEVARRLVRTFTEAQKFIRANAAEVVSKQHRALGIKTEAELRALQERIPEIYMERWDQTIIESAEKLLKRSVELGLLEGLPKEKMFIILR